VQAPASRVPLLLKVSTSVSGSDKRAYTARGGLHPPPPPPGEN